MSRAVRIRHNARVREMQPLYLYAVGLGSNRPLSGQMGPKAIVQAAITALDLPPCSVVARAPIIASRPIGPSMRSYANSAVIMSSPFAPIEMLDRLLALEACFGRRRYRRWGDRTLDLDLLLWSGGAVRSKRLTLPHAQLRQRDFVLRPLQAIAPRWRDPATGFTVVQLAARLAKPKPVDRREPRH